MSLRRDDAPVERISDLSGVSSSPLLAAGMMVVMFSMAGIPPLAGSLANGMYFWLRSMQGWFPLLLVC